MPLKLDAVGATTPELTHSYTWTDAVLYALSIGAKRDGELDFLWEGRGPKVFPTYAVVPTLLAHAALFDTIGGNLLGVVHGGQAIRVHAPFTASGTLKTVANVAGIYDIQRMATSIVTTETRDAAGTLLCETEWTVLYRMDGGFGGPPPPRREDPKPPARDPDWIVTETTSTEQAVLYRLNGDRNPLHIDPAIGEMAGFGKPILHGLCTYGFVGRAILAKECGGDPTRLRSLSGQFRKPVWPGDTLVTEGWRDGSRVLVRTSRKEAPGEHVFSAGVAEVA